MTGEIDYRFAAMGSEVRLLISRPLRPSALAPLEAADREREFVLAFARRLSRFAPDSELSALNRDRRSGVAASQLLRAAVSAGVWAAHRSDGLVDPTLVQALERSGYRSSLDDVPAAPLQEALPLAPPRRPARPHPDALWKAITVDDERGVIQRPPGVMIDTGGTGKGLCSDAVAFRLGEYTRSSLTAAATSLSGAWERSSNRTRSRSSTRSRATRSARYGSLVGAWRRPA
jgi:thiamine biosynthesis lipoprotein